MACWECVSIATRCRVFQQIQAIPKVVDLVQHVGVVFGQLLAATAQLVILHCQLGISLAELGKQHLHVEVALDYCPLALLRLAHFSSTMFRPSPIWLLGMTQNL